MKAQVGIIRGILPGFVTGIHKDTVHRWNLWFPSAGVFAEVLAGRATRTQITSPRRKEKLINIWDSPTILPHEKINPSEFVCFQDYAKTS